VDEAFAMLRGGGGDDAMAGIEDLLSPAVVDLRRSQISDAGVVVLVVDQEKNRWPKRRPS
jgi:hypothetical protein